MTRRPVAALLALALALALTIAARALRAAGEAPPRRADLRALEADAAPGWSTGADRYGPVTYIKLHAGQGARLTLEAP